MHNSSLKALLTLAVAFVGAAAHAASPVLQPLPVIIISDVEGNGTQDNNIFEFDATLFVFNDLVEDADTADDSLDWTFFYDSADLNNTGDLSINGVASLATAGDALTATTVINRDSGSTPIANAFFREEALSPTSGTAPFLDPTAITPSLLGAPADPDGDSDNDELVGELAVTFFVDDGTNIATDSTFVFTYDTTLADLSPVVDALVFATGVPAFPFVNLPLSPIAPIGTPGDNWIFRNWDQSIGGAGGEVGGFFSLLDNGISAGSVAGTNLSQEGTGTGNLAGSTGGAYSQWINPGNATSLFSAGNTYGVRAAMSFGGVSGTKDPSDALRIGVQENSQSSLNITYVVNTADPVTGLAGSPDHPFLPAIDGTTTRAYLSVADPIDADVAAFNDGAGPNPDLPFLFTYDLIDLIAFGAGISNSDMVTFEVGEVDTATYTANLTANVQGANNTYGGSGQAFTGGVDGWEESSSNVGANVLVGGGQFLRDPVSSNVSAANINIVTAQVVVDGIEDSQWREFSWFFDVNDIDGGAEMTEDGSYNVDWTFNLQDGANPGRPGFRFRPDSPVPTFSIEFVLTPARGSLASTTAGADTTVSEYFTAPTQLAGSASVDLTGQENDLNLSFGAVPTAGNDGTITFTGASVNILGLDDPNVDY